MRLCLCTQAVLSAKGLQATPVDALARQFQGLGHDVVVVAPHPPRLTQNARLPYRVLRLPRLFSAGLLPSWQRRWLLRLLRRERFDILHWHGREGAAQVATLCGEPFSAPTLVTGHGGDLTSVDWRAVAESHLALYKELHAEQEERIERSYPAHSSARRGLKRLARNLARTPVRLLSSFARRFRAAHRLQRQADRSIPRLFAPERLRDLEAVPGPTSARKCRLLAHLAWRSPPGGCFLEIGAYMGKSTAWLVEAAQNRSDRPAVVSIDPHLLDTWDVFLETLHWFDLLGRGLEFHRAFSHDLGVDWKRPISFLWIDGSHRYADVVNDIEDFLPHVIPGGWVVFDDASGGHCPGVERAIAERVEGRTGIVDVGTIKSFRLFRRR